MDEEPTREEIDHIRSKMNKHRPFEERWDYSKNQSTKGKLSDGWLASFIEGDGSFQYYLKGMMPTIQITQHNRYRPLLENIRDYLGDGSLKPSYKELKKKGVHTMEDLKKYGGKTD